MAHDMMAQRFPEVDPYLYGLSYIARNGGKISEPIMKASAQNRLRPSPNCCIRCAAGTNPRAAS